jgi:putative ABC transport system permease protein
LIVAALGAQSAVHRAVRVPPAEAMRPEAPARYRQSRVESRWCPFRLALSTRILLRNFERQPVRTLVSVIGIAFAAAVLIVGLAFIDVTDALISEQFTVAMRQDAALTFAEPRAARTIHDIAHLPGVLQIEPMRLAPVRLRAGARSRTVAITGLPAAPELNRVIDRRRGVVTLPPDGLVLSKALGTALAVAAGDSLQVEVLEGRRPVRDLIVTALVDDAMGLNAYMRLDALGSLLREGPTISGVMLTIDPDARARFYAALKMTPAVAGTSMRDAMLQNFRSTLAEHMNLSIAINVVFAGIIAFGVVYNAARVSLSERSRELASLRVLGFTRAEISMILLGELAVITLLALPVGVLIGYGFGELILAAFSNEVYRMSFVMTWSTIAWACLTVIAATAMSSLLVRRRLDHLDLVAVLKVRG